MGLPMKDWRVLVSLEYEWRAFRLYRKAVNWLVKRGMRLSSPILCAIKRKMDNHAILLPELKALYEKQTGRKVVFYKCDDFK